MLNVPLWARIALVGYTGCGKTTLAKALLTSLWRPGRKIFISDPMIAWETWGYECRNIHEVHQRLQHTDDAVVRLASFDDREQEQFCDLAGSLPNSIFVMDESSTFLKPSLRNCWRSLFHLTNHGRHHGQAIVLLAQHYAAIPVEFRGQAYIFSSNIAEGVGQDWLKKRAGFVPQSIPEYHWLVAAPDGSVGTMPPVSMGALTCGSHPATISDPNAQDTTIMESTPAIAT